MLLSAVAEDYQPPLGGCVLKQTAINNELETHGQPPLGGCVLKLVIGFYPYHAIGPAAFRRLCVETIKERFGQMIQEASRL